MPRYYFETNDGETSIIDDEGIVLDGVDAAGIQAHSALAEMARDVTPTFNTTKMMTVFVRDTEGTVVLRAALSILIEPTPTNKPQE